MYKQFICSKGFTKNFQLTMFFKHLWLFSYWVCKSFKTAFLGNSYLFEAFAVTYIIRSPQNAVRCKRYQSFQQGLILFLCSWHSWSQKKVIWPKKLASVIKSLIFIEKLKTEVLLNWNINIQFLNRKSSLVLINLYLYH